MLPRRLVDLTSEEPSDPKLEGLANEAGATGRETLVSSVNAITYNHEVYHEVYHEVIMRLSWGYHVIIRATTTVVIIMRQERETLVRGWWVVVGCIARRCNSDDLKRLLGWFITLPE